MQQDLHNLYLEVTRVYVALMRLAAFNALRAFLCPVTPGSLLKFMALMRLAAFNALRAFLCPVCAYICAVWACCLYCACYIFILDCNRAPHHREVHQCNRCLGQHSPLECTKPLPEGPPRNVDSGGRGGGGRGGRGGRGRNYKR